MFALILLVSFSSQTNAVCTAVAACGNITVAGCYEFSGNITFATANAVCSHILVSNVRLDGLGFWLTSTNVGSTGFIVENSTATAISNITIARITINNFTDSVTVRRRVTAARIDNNTFYRFGAGILLEQSNTSFITNNKFHNTLTQGKAQNDGNAIQVRFNARTVNITRNNIFNVSNGIVIAQGSGGLTAAAPAIVRDNRGLNFHQTAGGLGVGLGIDAGIFNSMINNSFNNSGYFTAGESRLTNPAYQPKQNNWTDNNFNVLISLNTSSAVGVFLINSSNQTVLWRNRIVNNVFGTDGIVFSNATFANVTFNFVSGIVSSANNDILSQSVNIDRNVIHPFGLNLNSFTAFLNNTKFANNLTNNNITSINRNLSLGGGLIDRYFRIMNNTFYVNTISSASDLNQTFFNNNTFLSNETWVIASAVIGVTPYNTTFNNSRFLNTTQRIRNTDGNRGANLTFVNNSHRNVQYETPSTGSLRSAIYQYWTRNWYVNQSGAPVSGANITIRNDQNRQVFSCISDANGWCNQTLHLQLFQNATLTDNHTIWNMSVTDGVTANTTNVTVDFTGNFILTLPATVITTCQTITVNSTLGADIVPGVGTCIRFGANNIQLNCADRRLDGNPLQATDDIAVDTNGFDNIFIRNCTIQGFTNNIRVINSTGVEIIDGLLSAPNAVLLPIGSPYNINMDVGATPNNVTVTGTKLLNGTSTDLIATGTTDNLTILNANFSGGVTNLNGLRFTGDALRVYNTTFDNYSEAISTEHTRLNSSIEFTNFTNTIFGNAQYCSPGLVICTANPLNISYSVFDNAITGVLSGSTAAFPFLHFYGSTINNVGDITDNPGRLMTVNFTNSTLSNYNRIALCRAGFSSLNNGFLNVTGIDETKIGCNDGGVGVTGDANFTISWWKTLNVTYNDTFQPVIGASVQINSTSQGKQFGDVYLTDAFGLVSNIEVLQTNATIDAFAILTTTQWHPWSFNATLSGIVNQTLNSVNASDFVNLLLGRPAAVFPQYQNLNNTPNFIYGDNYSQPLNWTVEWDYFIDPPYQVNFWFNGDNTTYVPFIGVVGLPWVTYNTTINGLGVGTYFTFWEAFNNAGNQNQTPTQTFVLSQNSTFGFFENFNSTFISPGDNIITNTSTSNFSNFSWFKQTAEGIVNIYLDGVLVNSSGGKFGQYVNTSPVTGIYPVSFQFCGEITCNNAGNYTDTTHSFTWYVNSEVPAPPSESSIAGVTLYWFGVALIFALIMFAYITTQEQIAFLASVIAILSLMGGFFTLGELSNDPNLQNAFSPILLGLGLCLFVWGLLFIGHVQKKQLEERTRQKYGGN